MKICHRKAASNTGIVGISETTRRGARCFSVSWRPAKGTPKHTTIYFTAETRSQALQQAIDLRRAKIAARATLEGAVRP